MNKKTLTLLTVAVVVVVGIIFAVALTVGHKTEASCAQTGTTHNVTIQNGVVSPAHTIGKQCDLMKITNRDDVTREIGFGPHEHHTPYDGVAEKTLHKDQSLTVTLDQKGDFAFHDHFHDETAATFTVN